MNNSYEQNNNSISIFIHDIHPPIFLNLTPEPDTFHPRFREELKLEKNVLRCSRKQVNSWLQWHFHGNVKSQPEHAILGKWTCASLTIFRHGALHSASVNTTPGNLLMIKIRSFCHLWWMFVDTKCIAWHKYAWLYICIKFKYHPKDGTVYLCFLSCLMANCILCRHINELN